jgi:hypothetical protein
MFGHGLGCGKMAFLADNSLVLSRSNAGVSVMHYTAAENAGLAPRFTSVATGETADDPFQNSFYPLR